MSLREPAWRVCSRELESSMEEERSEGARPTTYLLSPFGLRANRVILTGTLSPAEPLGPSQPPTFWRARLADPLGSVAVTAGTFQPTAMAQLRSVAAPRPAIVIGKTHLYRGRDQVVSVSVRAEVVRTVPEADERALLSEIVRHTLDRLDLLERLEHEPAVALEALRQEGLPPLWIQGARSALERYPRVDRAAFRRELRQAVERIAGVPHRTEPGGTPPAGLSIHRLSTPAAPAPPTALDRAEESAFLDVLDEAADASVDGYADLRDVLERIAQRGVNSARAEEVLSRLEESGAVEEPIVGKLRRP